MATARFQHSIQLPEDLEQAWLTYAERQPIPVSFNAFINRLIAEEMERQCIPLATIS
jgi:hypothetical protein